MKITCKMVFEYKNKKNAESIAKSIKVDNYIFVKTKTDGNRIMSEIVSKSIPSMLHTVDDYLSCVGVAEKMIDKT
ncbi:MAG: KEOPS complex subunit Pcc1 [Thermoplasmatales archaeon]|nr:KEOPS complex subunit Pcc1 [Thermoplasmatales archaeon]